MAAILITPAIQDRWPQEAVNVNHYWNSNHHHNYNYPGRKLWGVERDGITYLIAFVPMERALEPWCVVAFDGVNIDGWTSHAKPPVWFDPATGDLKYQSAFQEDGWSLDEIEQAQDYLES